MNFHAKNEKTHLSHTHEKKHFIYKYCVILQALESGYKLISEKTLNISLKNS